MWLAQIVSMTGTQMQVVALNWHVYLLTRSALALGFVGLTRVLPIIVFSLWGGVVADRADRRRVLLVTQSVMTLGSLLLAAITFLGHAPLWTLYALIASQAAASAFDNPARQALMPRLVPRVDLPGALSLELTAFHVAMIGGPALAGLIIAGGGGGLLPMHHWTSAVGDTTPLALIYLMNTLSFLGVLLALVTLKTSGAVDEAQVAGEPALESLRAGLRFVMTTPLMVWTMGLDFVATFFSGALSLLPIVADKILAVGASGYGWLMAAPALGALAGSLYTSVRPLPRRQGRVFLAAVAAYGLFTVGYGLSRSFWLTFVFLALGGLADLVSTVIRRTLRQLITPDELRGRMTSVNMIFFMGGPQLGELEAGLVASLFASAALGVMVSIVSGGVMTIVAGSVVALLAPHVREYQG